MDNVTLFLDELRHSAAPPGALLKETLAHTLREKIFRGELQPGERIAERKWAAELGVAQASVREAINILVAEGFVQKGAGRSAHVTLLGEVELSQMYQVRAAIEGTAAGLVAGSRQDLAGLERILEEMGAAAMEGDVETALWKDLAFHLRLCQMAGNPFLFDHARRLILPLFAFMAIRTLAGKYGPEGWVNELRDHQQIVEAMRGGDAFFAEQYTVRAIRKFGADARAEWAHDRWERGRGESPRRRPAAARTPGDGHEPP